MLATDSIVYVSSIAGKTASGEKTYGAPVPIPCILVKGTEFIPGKGEEIIRTSNVILTEQKVVEEQAVWLDKGEINDRKKALKVLVVETCYSSLDGVTVYRVKIG